MRITHLSFSNINSLAGTWSIDFANPSFSEGLFVLTGPTGAGKTSVLDAICLALYGKTVREPQITKEANEVMTRGTGSCHAEVTFEMEGRRYRARWSQKRAHGKPGGALQHAEREIAEVGQDGAGQVLASQLRAVEGKVLELTGMSFDQFTRAVLLAQGQFDTFLKARDNERADILEKITNTGDYSRIGAAVFARFQQEKARKEQLERDCAQVVVLPDDERTKLDAQGADLKGTRASVQKDLEVIIQQVVWIDSLGTLRDKAGELMRQAADLEVRRASHGTDFDKHAQALKARTMDTVIQAMDHAREAAAEAARELGRRKEQNQDAEGRQQALAPILQQAAQTAELARADRDRGLPRLQQLRAIDRQIALAQQEETSARKVLEEATSRHREAVKLEADAKQGLARAESDRDQASAYLQQHAVDGAIMDRFPPIKTQYAVWQNLGRVANVDGDAAESQKQQAAKAEQVAREAADAKDRHARELTRAEAALEKKQPLLVKLDNEKKDARKALTAAEAEARERKPQLEEQLELAEAKLRLARDVADLEEQRKALVAGQACPLCGSTEHPYVRGRKPPVTKADTEVKEIKAGIAKLDKAVTDRRDAYEEASQALEDGRAVIEELKTQCGEAKNESRLSDQAARQAAKVAQQAQADAEAAVAKAGKARQECNAKWVEVAAGLSALGVARPQAGNWEAISCALEKRQSDYKAREDAKEAAVIRIAETRKAIDRQGQLVLSTSETRAEKQAELDRKTKALEELKQGRRREYGAMDADQEEKRLRDGVTAAEQAHGARLKEKAALDANVTATRAEVVTATGVEAQAKQVQAEKENVAQEKCRAAGFPDVEACRAARWNDGEISRVEALEKKLDQERIEMRTKLEENGEQLAREEARALTTRTKDDLLAARGDLQSRIEALQKDLDDVTHKVRTDDENRERRAGQGKELETQLEVFGQWKRMNDMIGTEGGARFRKYAQGITLSHLLKVANPHLAAMTGGRYAMEWNVGGGDSLLPEVVDKHQAETRRPVSNLSGGETFMVSLALALGLSGMASGKLRVDSLFLDEGFGTLDNDALDRAIGTLNQLHQTHGKLIGVISHIDQLKNQIGTRIEVSRVGGGRSKLSGPGVERIGAAAQPEAAVQDDSQPAVAKKRGRPRKVQGESLGQA